VLVVRDTLVVTPYTPAQMYIRVLAAAVRVGSVEMSGAVRLMATVVWARPIIGRPLPLVIIPAAVVVADGITSTLVRVGREVVATDRQQPHPTVILSTPMPNREPLTKVAVAVELVLLPTIIRVWVQVDQVAPVL
jgi:hypothetical protein